jgi:hypothetical protein
MPPPPEPLSSLVVVASWNKALKENRGEIGARNRGNDLREIAKMINTKTRK